MINIFKVASQNLIPRIFYYNILLFKRDNFSNYTKTFEGIEITFLERNMLNKLKNINFIEKKLWLKYLKRGDLGLIATDNNFLVGICWLSINQTNKIKYFNNFPVKPNTAWIHSNWVNPLYRGRGIHKRMISKYIDDLDDCITNNKIDELYVNILKTNKVSLHNYLRLGFKQISSMVKIKWLFFTFNKISKEYFL